MNEILMTNFYYISILNTLNPIPLCARIPLHEKSLLIPLRYSTEKKINISSKS